ncbi:MAG: hypothetical protein AAFR12_17760 [Cyanobacteria bacterium J06626_6]
MFRTERTVYKIAHSDFIIKPTQAPFLAITDGVLPTLADFFRLTNTAKALTL